MTKLLATRWPLRKKRKLAQGVCLACFQSSDHHLIRLSQTIVTRHSKIPHALRFASPHITAHNAKIHETEQLGVSGFWYIFTPIN